MSRRHAERARSAAEAAQSAAAGAPGPTAAPRLPPGEPPLGGRLGGRLSELPGAAPAGPDFARERATLKRGLWPVAGCDEAGRGPLAGPVVAAAVILDPDNIPPGLDDSKKLTAGRRAALYDLIVASAEIGVAFGPPSRIDRDNIREAALWALAQAVRALPTAPRLVLVDGRDLIAVEPGCDCEAIVKGDARVLSIAAASIVAKVTRDRLMARIGAAHPGYGFERHCGYGVPEHARALNQFGATIHHRRTFAPVAHACGARSPGAPDADR